MKNRLDRSHSTNLIGPSDDSGDDLDSWCLKMWEKGSETKQSDHEPGESYAKEPQQ